MFNLLEPSYLIKCGRVQSSHCKSILGMLWQVYKDILHRKLSPELPTLTAKTNILCFLASVYDPLRLFAVIYSS